VANRKAVDVVSWAPHPSRPLRRVGRFVIFNFLLSESSIIKTAKEAQACVGRSVVGNSFGETASAGLMCS